TDVALQRQATFIGLTCGMVVSAPFRDMSQVRPRRGFPPRIVHLPVRLERGPVVGHGLVEGTEGFAGDAEVDGGSGNTSMIADALTCFHGAPTPPERRFAVTRKRRDG